MFDDDLQADAAPSGQDVMAGYPATDAEGVTCACTEGNRLWLENARGRDLSVAVTVGGATSAVLPQTAQAPTLLENTAAGSAGAVTLSIDGTSATLLEDLDGALVTRPEDVQVGMVVGRPGPPRPLGGPGIPSHEGQPPADLSPFLSEGVTEANSEIDIVMICEAATGPGAMGPGTHTVDALDDRQLGWLSGSLAQNTVANVANEAGNVAVFARDVGRSNRGQVVAALREVILNGRFTVKPIASWGGKMAIVFKGRTGSRTFLTAAAYGIRNSKMSYVSSYAQGAGDMARGVAKGNFIGFVIAAGFDVATFIQDEDPEKNWGDLLGALGVTFVKVWVAGYVGILAAAAVAGAIAGAPVLLVVGVGVGVAIAAGFLLDKLDDWVGFKDRARKIGRSFAGAVNRGLRSAASFVQHIATTIDGSVAAWQADWDAYVARELEEFRQNDPVGHCALFCSDPLDQLDAWMRGLTGRGIDYR